MARCSRCGWEYDLDIYVCDNCGYILKREPIEKIVMFRRPEAKVLKPNRPIVRIFKVLNPLTTSKAFRDINNKKDRRGGRQIRVLCAFTFALWLVAMLSNIKFTSFNGYPVNSLSLRPFDMGTKWIIHLFNFVVFLVFFIFGIFYYRISFFIYNAAYRFTANISVQLNEILAVRFNVRRKKSRFQTILSGAASLRRKKLKEQQSKYAFEQATSGKKALTKIRKTGINKIMNYSYAPFIVSNLISFFILFFLPNLEGMTSNISQSALNSALDLWWESNAIWFILDLLQIIALIWVAFLVSIAQREIGNTSTTRLLVGNLIMTWMITFVSIILRPTMGGGGLNIIETLGEMFG